jgi:hypothetical protein
MLVGVYSPNYKHQEIFDMNTPVINNGGIFCKIIVDFKGVMYNKLCK